MKTSIFWQRIEPVWQLNTGSIKFDAMRLFSPRPTNSQPGLADARSLPAHRRPEGNEELKFET
jgi:hypothetical protein